MENINLCSFNTPEFSFHDCIKTGVCRFVLFVFVLVFVMYHYSGLWFVFSSFRILILPTSAAAGVMGSPSVLCCTRICLHIFLTRSSTARIK